MQVYKKFKLINEKCKVILDPFFSVSSVVLLLKICTVSGNIPFFRYLNQEICNNANDDYIAQAKKEFASYMSSISPSTLNHSPLIRPMVKSISQLVMTVTPLNKKLLPIYTDEFYSVLVECIQELFVFFLTK